MERVDGGGFGDTTASRAGTGRESALDQPRCAIMGKWRFSQPSPMLSIGIPHRFATPLYKGRVASGNPSQSARMAIPTRAAVNTSATPMCLCVTRQQRDARGAMRNTRARGNPSRLAGPEAHGAASPSLSLPLSLSSAHANLSCRCGKPISLSLHLSLACRRDTRRRRVGDSEGSPRLSGHVTRVTSARARGVPQAAARAYPSRLESGLSESPGTRAGGPSSAGSVW